MKIAFLIPTLEAGGAERVVSLMANFWAEKGLDVIIFSLDSPVNKPFFSLHPAVKYYPLNLLKSEKRYLQKAKRTIHQIFTVRKHVKKHKPDVLIGHLDITIFLTITSTLVSNVKAIAYEGNNPYLNKTNKYLQIINNFLYRFADHIVLQTHQISKTFPSFLQDKISVIYNPVSKPDVQLRSEDYARNLSNKMIVSVGRLEPQKGYDVLLKAFYLFVKENQHPDWSLLIMGEGVERQKLEKLCVSYNIKDQVFLPGKVKKPYEQLRDCSIFVLSSRFEGLPNVLLEAMSLGLPVISTRCKFGPEEIIQHRQNGMLVPVEDYIALSETLEELSGDIKLCEQIGTCAKDIADVCSLERVMAQWEGVVKQLIGR